MFLSLDKFIIQIIGKPGAKLLMEMLQEFNVDSEVKDVGSDPKSDPKSDSLTPDLVIFLGSPKTPFEVPKAPILIGILSEEDYQFIQDFCQKHKVPLLVASPKKVATSYSHLKLPSYHYINLALSLSISSYIKYKHLFTEFKPGIPTIINIDKEWLSVSPDKFFQLRWFPKNNLSFIYEPGSNSLGIKLTIEWLQQRIIDTEQPFQIHTIIDIDTIPDDQEIKEYLLPLTTLAQFQNSFLIVNTNNTEPDPFDFEIYSNLMEIWNNPHFIPRRKYLAEPLKEFEIFSKIKFPPDLLDFNLSIRKPPIFILDSLESIQESLFRIDSKSYIIYIGKKENYLKIITP
jgi:hypothetical protein